MSFFRNLFSKKQISKPQKSSGKKFTGQHKARCYVDILKPNKQDSAFPMDIYIKIKPEGLGISFDEAGAAKLDGFTRAALIGMYHWLNNENSTKPFVMPFNSMGKVYCDFYQEKGNVTSFLESTEKPVDSVSTGKEIKIRLIYKNNVKGTELETGIAIVDSKGNTDNEATLALYNTILENKR